MVDECQRFWNFIEESLRDDGIVVHNLKNSLKLKITSTKDLLKQQQINMCEEIFPSIKKQLFIHKKPDITDSISHFIKQKA